MPCYSQGPLSAMSELLPELRPGVKETLIIILGFKQKSDGIGILKMKHN